MPFSYEKLTKICPHVPRENHPDAFLFNTCNQRHIEYCMSLLGYGHDDYTSSFVTVINEIEIPPACYL